MESQLTSDPGLSNRGTGLPRKGTNPFVDMVRDRLSIYAYILYVSIVYTFL